MRKLINRYTVGGALGSILAFLFALVSDAEFASAQAHRGRDYKPDPSTWVVWSAFGGVAGLFAALLEPAARLAARHPKLMVLISLLGIKLALDRIMPDLEGMDRACGGSSYDQAYRERYALQAGLR